MDKKRALILLMAVIVTAILSATMLTAYSANNGRGNSKGSTGLINTRIAVLPKIEVSEEFKERVINVAKGDPDVQKLHDEGYSIMGIIPIIKAIVQEDGTLMTKATGATIMLQKDVIRRAVVNVDLEKEKVMEIVTWEVDNCKSQLLHAYVMSSRLHSLIADVRVKIEASLNFPS